jgi:hypothetical protein
MMTIAAVMTGLFPYDPKIDSPLEHQHLILAYCAIWTVPLGYLGYIALKQRAASKAIPD